MAKPIDASWADDPVSDTNLNQTTYGQGTSFPSTWPTARLFWRTDLNLTYKNIGSEGTPSWQPSGGIPSTIFHKPFSSIIIPSTLKQLFAFDTPIPSGAGELYIGKKITFDGLIWSNVATSTPIYLFDFSSYADQSAFDTAWPPTGDLDVIGDPTNDRINFTHPMQNEHDGVNYNLGTALSDSKFTLRFKMVITSFGQGTDTDSAILSVGLSSNGSNSVTAQDYLGLRLRITNARKEIQTFHQDATALNNAADDTLFTTAISASTFYVEIRRTGTTTCDYRLYSDAGYSTLIEAKNGETIAATITGLQFFSLYTYWITGIPDTTAHTLAGYIDEIQIYDGINL
jgi:hypothetical protein